MRFVTSAVSLLSLTAAQFVPAPTDLLTKVGYANVTIRYKEVPAGICELDPNVKSYSGYADIAANQSIFFWFFETRNDDPSDAPLTVWINGGPGSSSMIGLFQENGPCTVDANYNPVNNPYSWSNVTNMLFIDQPAQTGHSYSIPVPGYLDDSGSIVELPNNTCPDIANGTCGTFSKPDTSLTANSTDAAASGMWKTLQGFMGVFPQYDRKEFFFTTESYGGHYGPVFNEYIEKQNANLPEGAKEIALEAVLIGNGWYDPLLQYQAYYNYTVFPGATYDIEFFNKTIQDQMYDNLYGPTGCVPQLLNCSSTGSNKICSDADNFCYEQVENYYDIYAGRDEYDSRELVPDPFPPEYYVQYLNTPTVQEAIGAFVNFTEGSNTVGDAFGSTGDDARVLSIIQDMQDLINKGIYVVMYTGDADYNCNWLGGEAVAEEICAPGFDDAGYTDIKTSDGISHGQVKQAANFAFLRIYESGHEVPFYQPLAALTMLWRVLNGKDVATGKTAISDSYITVGTPKSTYREGNATVQFGLVPTNATYNTTTNEPNPFR
ncbi:alpha/beta-hydrolase [Microthyrium microscopicum]|uniref:Alpha/beta-hydrolase n=1 Tax=Microthyrium microscopicum TaxID=703497 RepID=A0A6A6TWR6_9PEZI|nr:alpha/beta-hydrolase [Microthyrium microscopicum]